MSERRKSHRSSGIYKAYASNDVHYPKEINPLQTEESMERWRHLAEGMSQLAVNVSHLARIHSALSDHFNESFASFLYGLLITMFCNNFPESPNKELYEHKSIKGLSSRIDMLQDRVRMAKAKNQQLRAEIERRNRENQREHRPRALKPAQKDLRESRLGLRDPRDSRFETPTRRNPLFQKPPPKTSLLQSQSSSIQRPTTTIARSSSSIQRPSAMKLGESLKAQKVSVAHDDTYSTNDSFLETPSAGPNLDQPPRYMRGLFDKSASSNMKNTQKRVPLGKPNRVQKPSGSAAQRAQRSRQSRLNTRPPFR